MVNYPFKFIFFPPSIFRDKSHQTFQTAFRPNCNLQRSGGEWKTGCWTGRNRLTSLSTQQQWTSLCPVAFNVLLCQQVVTKILMFYIPVTKVLMGFWNNSLLEKHKQESSESSFVSDGKWAWTQTAAVMRMWACRPWTSCWTTKWSEAGPACSMCSLFPSCFSQKKAFVLSSDLTKSHVLPLSQNDKYSMMTCRCVTGSYEHFDDATVRWMWI